MSNNKVDSIDTFLSYLQGVEQDSNGYKAKCPVHNDTVQSLSITEKDKKILLKCHAGCSTEEIMKDLGLQMADLFLEKTISKNKKKTKRVQVAEYVYTDEKGNPLTKSIKYKPKGFSQLRWEDNKWKWGLGKTRRVLYQLPKLIEAAEKDYTVYLVEGEKDVHSLMKLGFIATTNPMGAGKWQKSYNKFLSDVNLVIIPDNDDPGKDHAKNIATYLNGLAQSIKILTLPGLREKEDVSDWISKYNGTKEKLKKLTAECPEIDYDNFVKTNSSKKDDEEEEPVFIPTYISKQILNIEQSRGRHWHYSLDKEVLFCFDAKDGYWKFTKEGLLNKIIREELIKITAEWDKKYYIKEVLQAMKDFLINPAIDINFDPGANPDLYFINLKNGMLDWKNNKLREHNKDYYSLFQLPVEYDAEANCPTWESVLADWVPEKEARMFLQEYVGYCLIPDTSQHKAVILHGTGSNGKSTFLDVLINLFGKNNLSNIPLHRLSERFETANIQDKLVNLCSDIDPTYLRETGIIKVIIAGEPLRGEYKYGASFDFKPVVRLIFSANEIPQARDKTEAWYRRLEIVEFPNKFTKEDPNFDPYLEDKLILELPGILNWAVEGLKRLRENKSFTESLALREAKKEYERENDTIIAFLEDCTVVNPDYYIVGHHLYKEYQIYCENAGLQYQSRKSFSQRLKQEGFLIKKRYVNGKTQRVYVGVDYCDMLSDYDANEKILNSIS